jgi:hypothetical protein
MYTKIVNPKTGRKVNISTTLGKSILSNYIENLSNLLKVGGAPFNSGKMEHIYQWKKKENPKDTTHYTENFYNEEAKEALENGTFYLKIDGSNGAIFKGKDEETGEDIIYLVERYDDRNDKLNKLSLSEIEEKGIYPLPEGANKSVYCTEEFTHHYYYKIIPKPESDGRGKKLKGDQLQRFQLYTILEKIIRERPLEYGYTSLEFVGTKFNQTPGIDQMCGIAIHEDLILPEQPPKEIRNFDGMEQFCTQQTCEGFIVKHKDNYWKIREDGFTHQGNYKSGKNLWSNTLHKNFLKDSKKEPPATDKQREDARDLIKKKYNFVIPFKIYFP